MRGLSLVAASGGHSSSRCVGLSLSRPLLLWSTGSRRTGSVVVAHGRSCSAACGILPDQGSNPSPPHWQADYQPLRHQGSPYVYFLSFFWWECKYSSCPSILIWYKTLSKHFKRNRICIFKVVNTSPNTSKRTKSFFWKRNCYMVKPLTYLPNF